MKTSVQERYARAVESHTLFPHSGSASVLTAAGMASQRGWDRGIALTIWRMRDGGRDQFDEVADVLSTWIRREAESKRMKNLGRKRYSAVASRTLFWFLSPVCIPCHGRGHPVIADTPVLDETRSCPECHGTGITPLERVLQPDTIQYGRMIANRIDQLTASVFAEMRRKLR